MIDSELISRKISLISKDLDSLIEIEIKGEQEFLQDKINQTLSERYLERVIGRMIDINYHIVTEKEYPPPRDYFQSFIILGELNILNAKFARKIASCAGLRNRLVHEYDEVDSVKLFDGLKAAVRDIPVYLEQIAHLI